MLTTRRYLPGLVEKLSVQLPIYPTSVMELQRFTENNEFSLSGEKDADNTIALTLRIVYSRGHGKTIHFEFYLDSDTAISIAGEMAEQLDLSNEDVSVTAELIDSSIMKIVPSWKPTSESSSCGGNSLCGNNHVDGNLFWCPWGSGLVKAESMVSDISAKYGINTGLDVTSVKGLESEKYSYDECYIGSDGYSSSPDFMVQGQLKEMNYEGYFGDSVLMNNISRPDSLSSICSLSELSLMDKHPYDKLQMELDSIDVQFRERLIELLKMKEEAIRSAKKKWLANEKVTVN